MSKRTEKRCRFRNEQKEQHLLVNARRQADHQACVANLPPERILYLTLDIGKNVNWSRADTDTGRMVIAPQEWTDLERGLAQRDPRSRADRHLPRSLGTPNPL